MQNHKNKYDVAIIGGGIGGIMAAHRLSEKNPSLSICILEKGNDILKRVCPIITKQVKTCVKCKSCAIMEGMAGAGAFSDGKYVISTEYGGWLTEFMPPETVIDYIEQADKILMAHGATTERYMPDNELKKLCLQHDLHMSQAQLKHLGTDANFDTMRKLIDFLRDKVDILTNTEVTDVDKTAHTVTYSNREGEQTIEAGTIIFAIGRAGSSFFSKWCKRNGIPLTNNQVDIGVRVELPAMVWEDFSKKIYEPKIWYRSERYGDTTRMFCFNEGGLPSTGTLIRTRRVRPEIPTLPFSPPAGLPNLSGSRLSTPAMLQALQTSSAGVPYWCSGWATWNTAGEPMKNGWRSQPSAQRWTR